VSVTTLPNPASVPDPRTPRANAGTPIGGTSANARSKAPSDGVAFRALLERLESSAREIEAESRSVNGPRELSGAVGRARASLEDAAQLGAQLLEAYQQARQAPAPTRAANGPGPSAGGSANPARA